MKRKPIDVDELKKVFRIRDGNLERIDRRYLSGKWKPVKLRANSLGYCQVEFNGRMVYYHTIVWCLSTGKDVPSNLQIDHINGNRLDSRMENMRLVTNRGNSQNMEIHRDGQLVGGAFNKRDKSYMPKIQINSKLIHLGYFETKKEVHRAYTIACEHIKSYVDNESFRELIKKEMGGK